MYAFLKEWWEVALADSRGMSEKATCVPVEHGQQIVAGASKLPPVSA
jgi:hypothetical protein